VNIGFGVSNVILQPATIIDMHKMFREWRYKHNVFKKYLLTKSSEKTVF